MLQSLWPVQCLRLASGKEAALVVVCDIGDYHPEEFQVHVRARV